VREDVCVCVCVCMCTNMWAVKGYVKMYVCQVCMHVYVRVVRTVGGIDMRAQMRRTLIEETYPSRRYIQYTCIDVCFKYMHQIVAGERLPRLCTQRNTKILCTNYANFCMDRCVLYIDTYNNALACMYAVYMYACMYIYIHTYIHIYIYIYIPA
jgi:hypothetical protein